MPIIDAQVHAYERNHPGRPWVGTLAGPAEVTGDQMTAAMDEVGVDAAVLVSPFSMYGYDPSYALEVGARHPTRFCLVRPVDPNDPVVAETIADWAAKQSTVGVRIMMRDNVSTDPADAGINRVLQAAARHSLAVNLLCWGRQEQAGQLAARNPNTQIVISGACTLSHQPFPYEDIWDPLGRIFDAFGINRCLWGTDWTRAVNLLTYKDGVGAFRVTDCLSDSDRALLMGESLMRVYNWSPSSA